MLCIEGCTTVRFSSRVAGIGGSNHEVTILRHFRDTSRVTSCSLSRQIVFERSGNVYRGWELRPPRGSLAGDFELSSGRDDHEILVAIFTDGGCHVVSDEQQRG
jgi:hypothetical protein